MDLTSKAISRILWQYRNSTKFVEWIKVLPDIMQEEIEDPLDKIINILDIDSQEGAMLDIVGRIVGQLRNHQLLNDDEVYKIVIKSKAFKNYSDATIDSIVEAAEQITGSSVLKLEDEQDMSFFLVFSEGFSDLVRQLLLTFDLIPRPQGVKLAGVVEGPPEGPIFGFSEPGLATPSYIGGFAEIVGDGAFNLELSDGSLLGLSDGSLLGIGVNGETAVEDGGYFTELLEVA